MNARTDWRELLRQPRLGDHIVQVYQDEAFLSETVSEYLAAGLRKGEGAIVICGAARQSGFKNALAAAGIEISTAASRGQLVFLDAAETLARFMRDGMPDCTAFHSVVGGAIAALRLDYPSVRAYGDMVDALWRDGQRDAAIRLEEYWNDLTRLQTFSLLCAYYLDNLDPASYGGALQCVCKVHTHLIPARDYARMDEAVAQASRDALDESLARMLLSLAAAHRPSTEMPLGQATLLWLKDNMPLTAEKVLAGVRARC